MIVRMGMLQVYSVISVVMLDHDAESAVELRHGGGGGVPIVYHHQKECRIHIPSSFTALIW